MEKRFEHRYRLRVSFADTDMAGIVHFSNFFKWMEAAEADLFRLLEEPFIIAGEEDFAGWPRVRVSCSFHAPLSFGDEVEVHLAIKELKVRAIAYVIRFYKVLPEGSELAASGEMTTIFVKRPARGGPMRSASIPASLMAKITEAPPELLKAD